jgi:hypothetical protein
MQSLEHLEDATQIKFLKSYAVILLRQVPTSGRLARPALSEAMSMAA